MTGRDSSSSAILDLNPDDAIASGVQRAVFDHPSDSTKLIKVLKRAEQMPVRTNFNGVMDRLMPSTRIRQIRKEYQEYLRIMLLFADTRFHPPFAHMYGFATTNLGLGCITQKVMDPDGTLAKPLGKRVREATVTDGDINLLNDCIRRIYNYGVRASDLNAMNFAIGHRDDGSGLGPRECVLVDGFGDIHALPFRSLSRWSNEIGLNDSCTRLAKNTKLDWNAQTRQFSR